MRKGYDIFVDKKIFYTDIINVKYRRLGLKFDFEVYRKRTYFGLFKFNSVIAKTSYKIKRNLALTDTDKYDDHIILNFTRSKKLKVSYNPIKENLDFECTTTR